MRKVPTWKVDGYSNYASAQALLRHRPERSLESRITLLLNDRHWAAGLQKTRKLFRSRLVVEYLCEVRGLAFEEIIDDHITEDGAIEEMLAWYRRQDASEIDVVPALSESRLANG